MNNTPQTENVSDRILSILNEVYQKDPKSIIALVSLTVPTNYDILQSFKVRVQKGYVEFGILSIINKLIEPEFKKIIFNYSVDYNGIMLPDENEPFEIVNIKR
jgi:hypothetical protein